MVEFALVALVAIPLLFSILEYCRFVFMRQLLENATREGARYAVVRTYESSTSDIQAVVLSKMGGQQNNLAGFNILVYRSDPVTGNSVGAWTDAKFGEMITVQITGTYHPVAGWMPASIPLDIRAVMASEAN